MRFLLLLSLVATAAAQSGTVQTSHTTENLRGVSAVSRQVAWASGTHGTYLRTTDGGRTWIPGQVPDASALDFRAVVAFSADEAFLMSAGPGDQSRIYHTSDGGQHWQLQFTNSNPKGFFDSIAFWDPKHGVVLGDPILDEKGKLKFELLQTEDGESWHVIPPSQLPEASEGEGAFAASNSCLARLRAETAGSVSAPSSTVEERRSSAASGAEEKGASAPRPEHLVRHRWQNGPRLPLPRPRKNLGGLQHSDPPRSRIRRHLLHRLPRCASRRHRRRRLQTSQRRRPQPGIHRRWRQDLDALQPASASVLLCRGLRPTGERAPAARTDNDWPKRTGRNAPRPQSRPSASSSSVRISSSTSDRPTIPTASTERRSRASPSTPSARTPKGGR